MAKGASTGSLPTAPATTQQTVILVQSLLVTWNVLEHLEAKGVIQPRKKTPQEGMIAVRAAAGCCKPDGGTCCVNRQ
jgi:hypothetical protein